MWQTIELQDDKGTLGVHAVDVQLDANKTVALQRDGWLWKVRVAEGAEKTEEFFITAKASSCRFKPILPARPCVVNCGEWTLAPGMEAGFSLYLPSAPHLEIGKQILFPLFPGILKDSFEGPDTTSGGLCYASGENAVCFYSGKITGGRQPKKVPPKRGAALMFLSRFLSATNQKNTTRLRKS
jgi:hypothetical protein